MLRLHSSAARRAAVAVTATGLTAVLGACSGSSGSGATAASSTAAAPVASTSSAASPAPTSAAPSDPAPSVGATGGLSEVPSLPVTTAPAVPIGSPVTIAGVTVSIGTPTAFTGVARVPGELGGPAVAVPVTLSNGTGSPVQAGNVVVDLETASGDPATPLSSGPAQPLSGTVAPGASARGVYAFTLAEDQRADVSISVSYSAGVAVALFRGSVAS